jgi:hypothetical protein
MISMPSILRAGVKRFVPGVVAFLIGSLVVSASWKEITLGPSQMAGFAQLIMSMFAGHVAGLATFRKKIGRTARIDGRRTVLAGFASAPVLLVLEILHGSPTGRLLNCAFAFAAGAGTSVLLFAPWMTRSARSLARADDLDVLEAAESVLADRPPIERRPASPRPTKTPRQNSPIRAD